MGGGGVGGAKVLSTGGTRAEFQLLPTNLYSQIGIAGNSAALKELSHEMTRA